MGGQPKKKSVSLYAHVSRMVGRWGQGHFTWSRTHVRTQGPPLQGQWSEEDVFVSRAATDVTTHVQYTHPDRANQAACGTNVADDKRDKLSPLMTHDCTCLQSCAREVFTIPGAKR